MLQYLRKTLFLGLLCLAGGAQAELPEDYKVILLTSMDQDGVKSGYDLGVTRAISEAVGIPVIASGGVGHLEHLAAGIIDGKADAVLAASIFHFGEYSVPEAKAYLASRGIVVR